MASADAADGIIPPASLTQTPRQITPRARRRSWNELPVRIWVILAVAVALITGYFTVNEYLGGRYERWLITQGTPLTARVMWINGVRRLGETFNRTDRLQAQLHYTPPGADEELEYVPGWLAQLPDQKPVPTITIGDMIPIRIDPDNVTTWTDRERPRPWLAEFTVVLLLLPALVLLTLIALLRRTRVLDVWRRGEVAAGAVVELKQSAIAPFSRVVRFTFADGSDRRVFSTLHPAKNAPATGEVLWVVFPRGKPANAIVADLYV